MKETINTAEEKAIAQAIIADINNNIDGVTKPKFFPLALNPIQRKFLQKHSKYAGKYSESAFIIEMFEAFFEEGVFVYTRETQVNNVLKVAIRNLGNNLNQARANLITEQRFFKKHFNEETYENLMNEIKESFKLLLAVKKLISNKYKRMIPAACIESDSAIHNGDNGRPKVQVKKVRSKLYLSAKQRELFNEKMNQAGKKQLSRFLRDTFLEMHQSKNFKYKKPVKINENLQNCVKWSGDELNKAVHDINTSMYNYRSIHSFKFNKPQWESLIVAVKKAQKPLQDVIERG